jgi:hypothetical protein
MSLSRLFALIELAVGSANPEESRTAAVMACHMIRDGAFNVTEKTVSKKDDAWTTQELSSFRFCAECGFEIETGQVAHVNRVSNDSYHAGCIP